MVSNVNLHPYTTVQLMTKDEAANGGARGNAGEARESEIALALHEELQVARVELKNIVHQEIVDALAKGGVKAQGEATTGGGGLIPRKMGGSLGLGAHPLQKNHWMPQ